ncbi:MAG: T9SS type A sorting domain-containing protein, partial [Bacteroidota bacterium]|nr:T9SS type A sorting domain-containing protein [Bacteroidota bacterium]
ESVLEVTNWVDGDSRFATNAISIAKMVETIHELSLLNSNDFMLKQNMPNPFKDETTISFYLPYECHATVELYSIMGECIALLYSEIASGYVETIHELSLPAGTYYYRLQTPGFSNTKSMIIVR